MLVVAVGGEGAWLCGEEKARGDNPQGDSIRDQGGKGLGWWFPWWGGGDCPSGDRSSVWRLQLSQLGRGSCHWHLVGRGQGCY